MKRASYREAVRWIAENDDGLDYASLDYEEVQGSQSVRLIAAIFGVKLASVALDVVKIREKGLADK